MPPAPQPVANAIEPKRAESCASRIAAFATSTPDAIALLGVDRRPLHYSGLWGHIQQVVSCLSAAGIRRGDRIALTLPDGPEMATAFLATSACATSAPLNPAYRAEECRFYLTDLQAKLLIAPAGSESPAVHVAREMGIPVMELSVASDGPAGLFHLSGAPVADRPGDAEVYTPDADDVALVLHTSGTTSRPKLVPLSHGNLAASARHIRDVLRLTPADRCLNVMPLFHIHGLAAALMASLTSGASVACSPGFQAPAFYDWLDLFAPTWYTAVPTMHLAILSRSAGHRDVIARRPLRFIRSSSAALPPTLMRDMEAAFQVPVIESYGMTEAAHQMASNPLPPRERKPGAVGLAAGPDIAIMDAAGVLLSAGETGEIVIRGPNVTSGYDANPVANEGAFAAGWFRTGDQGTLDDQGYLRISGRLKEIINRGGEKISPREIDEVLLAHPAVAQAVAFAIPDPRLGEDVGAVVVLKPEMSTTETDLREFAAARLASFKVPRRVLLRGEIPKGPTGKLQRIGLAEKLGVVTEEAVDVEFAAPRDAREATIARIWQDVLRVPRVGVHHDFVELGGDSILAAQIVSRIATTLSCQVSLIHFLDHPTVAGLAASLDSPVPKSPIPIQPRTVGLPLSDVQRRLWFLDQLDPGSPVYNRPVLLRLTGTLDVVAVERALQAIVQRHEPLRTVFKPQDGVPWQWVLQGSDLLVARVSEDDIIGDARRPFDLERGPLFRAALARRSEHEHLLLLATHHIVFDDWSERVLIGEFAALYGQFVGGQDAALPALAVQFADLAAINTDFTASIGVWRDRLATAEVAEIYTDFPRPPVQVFTGARITRSLPMAFGGELKAFSRRHGVTLFTTLLAAFQTLLARYTGEADISVGTPVHGRTAPEAEPLIGVFINTLVLRTNVADDPSGLTLLARVRQIVLDAIDHQGAPFAQVVDQVGAPRDLSRSPLFQTLFQLRDVSGRTMELPTLRIEPMPLDIGVAKFDLSVEVVDRNGVIECVGEYNTSLFTSASVERLLGHFQRVLEGLVAEPARPISTLSLLSVEERAAALSRSRGADQSPSGVSRLHEFFEAQVARSPLAIAAEFGDEQITYADLQTRADELAARLGRLGVAADCSVGIAHTRSIDMIVAVLGVLKAGGACVPLDPTFPPQRLALMAEEAGVQLILRPGEVPATAASPISDGGRTDPLAYVLFTSGSTGRPKAVAMGHAPLCNLIAWHLRSARAPSGPRTLQFASLSFDVAFQEMFSTWAAGGTLVVIEDALVRDVPTLWRLIDHSSIARLFVPFVALRALAEAAAAERRYPPALREIITAGEQLQITESVRHLFEQLPGCSLENQYGPAESHVVTAHVLPPAVGTWPALPAIGRPIANARTYVLDARRQPVSVGVPGELYIGGPVLADGYLNQPALTSERFVADPFVPGARMYQTGDRARWLPNDDLEFLGRADRQVKVRGYRIEPGEIEVALSHHPDVSAAWVTAVNGERLLAYVTLKECSRSPTHEEWVAFLRQSLPEPLVPAAFVCVAHIARLASGKVDRRSLPEPDLRRPEVGFAAPTTEVEIEVANVWAGVLGVERVGLDDNFFDLGGHSLALAQVHARLYPRHKGTLSIVDMFRYPTVRSLAQHLRRPGKTATLSAVDERARQQRTAFERQRARRP